MASLHKQTGDRPGFKIRWRDSHKRARALWLGDVSKKSADTYYRHVVELVDAQSAGRRPEPSTETWLRSKQIDSRIRLKLTELGLAEPVNEKLGTDAGTYLGAYLDAYIAGRTDCKPGTIDNFKHARRLLVEKFGERQLIATITAEDAERWRRWLSTEKNHAEATASKHVKRAKTMFLAAVKDRLLTESPFAGLRAGNEANSKRHFNVTAEITADVLDACPDDDWRLIFGLARFCGMRCPSEVLNLKWTDVLWDKSKLRIDSPKTGLRFCPIFPELMPSLLQASENAPDGATYCIQRYRRGYNPATTMAKIIQRAGHEPWPKIFINLRSTRRTELERAFPNHVVNKWLGHGRGVAEKHYLQTTDEDWKQGATKQTIELGGNAGGNTLAAVGANRSPKQKKKLAKPRKNGSASLCVPLKATPQGLEEPRSYTANTPFDELGGNAGGNTLGEMAELWPELTDEARESLLAIARQFASAGPKVSK